MNRMTPLLVISAAAFALAGCQSTTEGKADAGAPVASPPATSIPIPTTTTTTAAEAPDDSGDLTPTGSTLDLGETATVRYETKSGGTETTKLDVTVKSLKKGSIDDMQNFDLDAQSRQSDPFYVTVTFKNAGPEDMEPGGIFGLINVTNADGEQMGRLSLYGDFPKCEGIPPEQLPVGKSFTTCEIYTAPRGQQADKVIFGFYLESERTEITWNAA